MISVNFKRFMRQQIKQNSRQFEKNQGEFFRTQRKKGEIYNEGKTVISRLIKEKGAFTCPQSVIITCW